MAKTIFEKMGGTYTQVGCSFANEIQKICK